MKNYLVLGEKWKRAIVFWNEQYANHYIERNCLDIPYQKYSEAEFHAHFAEVHKKYMEYGPNHYMAQSLILLEG